MSDKKQHKDQEKFKSALNVQGGVEQPDSINPEVVKRFRKNKKVKRSVQEYVEGILEGNRTILGQAITLIESSLPEHNQISQEIIEKCLPYAGKSVRIGITGVPGVGKSTFIESMGKYITSKGNKLAVLAVDPSSERSRGSILGDKTRMEELSNDPDAFIRPSPSAGSLGGVARKTRETIILCEAAGFNIIFIETVGVGQSETAVHSMVDFFLLLMLAGAGDELQGIKRGIMEMADAIVINKADGENIQKAELAKNEYQNALHLFPPTPSGWVPQVLTCSALKKAGIDQVWTVISDFIEHQKANLFFDLNRKEQAKYWMYESIHESLKNNFYQQDAIKAKLKLFEENVLQGRMNSFLAARMLLNEYYNKK
ncbi:MAG: methylmalonyl Co-A mutase-associated GTPase MeaB [Bacteroidales bacterium]|jgi:LAO/AO transport system kinase|nr:methylmalonyl Co-A mutase-associated GTPase MeaB [Bacteroidales bacterium]